MACPRLPLCLPPGPSAGTPSLISLPLLEQLLAALDQQFGLAAGAEVSIEADPGTFDAARLRAYLGMGVTRVSVGVQVGWGGGALASCCGALHLGCRAPCAATAAPSLPHQEHRCWRACKLAADGETANWQRSRTSLPRACPWAHGQRACTEHLHPPGLQAFQDELLALCGRAHDVADALRAVEAVHAAGVPSWSLDLMSGLPQASRAACAALPLAHASSSQRCRRPPCLRAPVSISAAHCSAGAALPGTLTGVPASLPCS